MTRSYYECHITLQGTRDQGPAIQDAVEQMKWKYSVIDGDPVLGEGVKHYATTFFNAKDDKDLVLCQLLDKAEVLKFQGFDVIRTKVELVIWDSKSDKVNWKCNGNCAECSK